MDTTGLDLNYGKNKFNGLVIDVTHDHEEHNNPRDWDNAATMVCGHGRYSLGDENGAEKAMEDISNSKLRKRKWDDMNWSHVPNLDYMARECDFVVLPLYLYDHSGITMNTTGFSCPWDSGQVGFIYMTKEQVREEFSVKLVTKKVREMALKRMRQEVETYDMFIRGDVWHYSITDDDGELIDSCGGVFGNDYLEEEVKAVIENHDS